jgi:hypothetical protein
MRRAATLLRQIGLDICFEREGRARTRVIRITTTGKLASSETGAAQPSASSAPSAYSPKATPLNGFAAPDMRTVGSLTDGSMGGNGAGVRDNPLKSHPGTAADGADAKHLPRSAPKNARWSARL